MKILILGLLAATPFLLNAQSSVKHYQPLEVGFMIGTTNYSGDVSERQIVLGETRLGYGAFIRKALNPKFALKAQFYSGNISGDDKNNAKLSARKFRFSTNVLEFSGVVEWHFLGKERVSSTGISEFRISPYIFGGAGITIAQQSAKCYGTPEECAKYTTIPFPEPGLNNKFLVTPAGLGARFDVAERLAFGLEIGFRPVYSDDLDGISINGNPDQGDWYYFVGGTASFMLNDPTKAKRD